MVSSRGILDTSVFIASETGRLLDTAALPDESATTVITLAELRLGVLAARDSEIAAIRLRTLEAVGRMKTLDVDDAAASTWATLRIALRNRGQRMNVNDLWIAAIAVANELAIVTQDADFDVLDSMPGVEIIRV